MILKIERGKIRATSTQRSRGLIFWTVGSIAECFSFSISLSFFFFLSSLWQPSFVNGSSEFGFYPAQTFYVFSRRRCDFMTFVTFFKRRQYASSERSVITRKAGRKNFNIEMDRGCTRGSWSVLRIAPCAIVWLSRDIKQRWHQTQFFFKSPLTTLLKISTVALKRYYPLQISMFSVFNALLEFVNVLFPQKYTLTIIYSFIRVQLDWLDQFQSLGSRSFTFKERRKCVFPRLKRPSSNQIS